MTGIERLRELIDAVDNRIILLSLRNVILDIADQIERELQEERDRWDEELCEAQMDKHRVMAVYLEMNKHVSGVEGAEDSPVARWARELREALGGKECDPADLLPPDERDAIAWVRERGGLEEVEARWSGRVPLTNVKRMVALHKAKRERLKAHAVWLECKCHERQERICELNKLKRAYVDALNGVCKRLGLTDGTGLPDMPEVIWTELDRRLMPEGMEWLVEAWPRFEDGEPVRVGDEISWRDEGGVVNSIELQDGGYFILHAADGAEDWILPQYFPGERVKRPIEDTWERLEEDVAKSYADYWGCGGLLCSECPAVVDGERPLERFGCDEYPEVSKCCTVAKARDIVRRAKALAERGA